MVTFEKFETDTCFDVISKCEIRVLFDYIEPVLRILEPLGSTNSAKV